MACAAKTSDENYSSHKKGHCIWIVKNNSLARVGSNFNVSVVALSALDTCGQQHLSHETKKQKRISVMTQKTNSECFTLPDKKAIGSTANDFTIFSFLATASSSSCSAATPQFNPCTCNRGCVHGEITTTKAITVLTKRGGIGDCFGLSCAHLMCNKQQHRKRNKKTCLQ